MEQEMISDFFRSTPVMAICVFLLICFLLAVIETATDTTLGDWIEGLVNLFVKIKHQVLR